METLEWTIQLVSLQSLQACREPPSLHTWRSKYVETHRHVIFFMQTYGAVTFSCTNSNAG